MPKTTKERGSVYDRIPGLRDAQKPQNTPGGSVRTALRGLGIEEQDQLLTPVDPVSAMLLRTGRSDGTWKPGDKLGGPRSEAAEGRLEDSAGEVMRGMERGTADNQRQHNAFAKNKKLHQEGQEPLKSVKQTHAVSAHGKGTDQIGRLLHGRRADELEADDRRGSTIGTKKLTGNGDIGDVEVDDYATVGKDPKNTSGAFKSNVGMLDVVTDAFSQAAMLDRHRTEAAPSHDKDRFVTTVKGSTDELGYNLSIDGMSEQVTGHGLAKDETEARYKKIKRQDGLQNATIVLDRAMVGGKRAGWNLQTAYANSKPVATPLSSKESVQSSPQMLLSNKVATEQRLSAATKALASAKKSKKNGQSKVAKATKEIASLEAKKIQQGAVIAALKVEIGEAEEAARAPLEKKLVGLEKALGATTKQIAGKHKALVAAQGAVQEAETAINRATVALPEARNAAKRAAEALEKAEAAKAKSGGDAQSDDGPSSSAGGYDAGTGQWTVGRPAKPGDLDGLRGEDGEGDALTAHHLYPWNRIEADLNAALASQDEGALQQLFAFGEVEMSELVKTELKLAPAERSLAFSDAINAAVPRICWSPSNVFMGPLGSKRGDDPGEELDAAPAHSQFPTPASALAAMTAKDGGIGKQSALTQIFMRNIRLGGGEAQAYERSDWKTVKGKKERHGDSSTLLGTDKASQDKRKKEEAARKKAEAAKAKAAKKGKKKTG